MIVELMSISKERMIEIVIAHKDRIREATDQLSEIIYKAKSKLPRNAWKLDEESALAVRKTTHEIVEEISIIGGFCDGWTRNYIAKTTPIIAEITAFDISVLEVQTLELFGTIVNFIAPDFNKTPFKWSQLKPAFEVLKAALGKSR